MQAFLSEQISSLSQTPGQLIFVYIFFYGLWGTAMHHFGIYMKIARFKYAVQIISCYILYMVPISILLKSLPWHQQYAYGLFFMGILELGGYTIKSSIAYENNLLDKIFTERNFSLAMTLFFAAYFPLGNWIVENLYNFLFQ